MGESVNEQPAEELHKPVIKQCNRRKVSARFKDNIWMVDLTEIGSLSSKYENLKYLVCEVDVSTKYALVKTSNEKKGKIVLNVFIKIINEYNGKPNNYGFIKEENFTKILCKNGLTIIVF